MLFDLVVATALLSAPPSAADYFAIRVVDEETGRGVPMVELRAVDGRRYWTDSGGVVAFREPGLMNQKVFFYVKSHGYEFPADGLGFRGKALVTVPGGEAELKLKLYFGNPYPLVRVRATAEALRDPASCEAFTCLAQGSRLEKPAIERGPDGTPRYAWKRGAPVPTAREQEKWLAAGMLKAGETLLALRDADTGRAVQAHAGSVAWNAFRRRFVMIAEQSGGSSNLGEIWYAEGDTPLGPWIYARKIVTHDKYSFYNPRHHPVFDQEGGRRIFFEGTYSTFFSGNDDATPLYDYNQIMYELDLDDPRLVLPVPIYEQLSDGVQKVSPAAQGRIAFLAADRPREGFVAVGRAADGSGLAAGGKGDVGFYALPADMEHPPPTSVALYEYRDPSSRRYYAVEGNKAPIGFMRAQKPLCRVWRYPITVDVEWK